MGTNKYLLKNDYGILEIKSVVYGKHFVLFDLDDYDKLKNYTWRLLPDKNFNTYYAVSGSRKNTLMHRVITDCNEDMVVDHQNHNGLDNRKENLRVCTRLENMQNQRYRKNNKSGYSNICFEKERNKWVVVIRFKKKCYKKRFSNINEAVIYRDKLFNFLKNGGDELSELTTML